MLTRSLTIVLLSTLAASSCASPQPSASTDAFVPPTDGSRDAAGADAGPLDAGPDALVDAAADAGPDATPVPLSGYGDIDGTCGFLDDAEWNATAPFAFRNRIDFGAQVFDASNYSAGC